MFTGIIEEIGKVKNIVRGTRSISLEIEAEEVLKETKIGDSIATNGVCLTVTSMGKSSFVADVMPETMRMTSLGQLKSGSKVNLERALTLTSRLGGHMVAGHVDGTGRIVGMDKDDTAIWITVSVAPEILRYIINKGSVAIDGVSLTVAYVDEAVFKVSIIPHTQEETTLTGKHAGDIVNIENDMIARYVEKLMKGGENKGMSLEFLLENGF
ncbi:riboflavin synthase [Porphyromonadaceae bacterium OttesenSCG-928-L07]|nr:riboflavin synthase [Porphyromonadaceae bacterium OttesenSCG-928-L07]